MAKLVRELEGRNKVLMRAQVSRTESTPLQIATMMTKLKCVIDKYEYQIFEEKFNFHLVLLELPVKQHPLILP